MATFDETVGAIEACRRAGTTTLVAIDGHGGSGKSTLATRLQRALDGATVVHGDHLRANPEMPQWRKRLHDQVIAPLLAGKRARYAHEDWRTGEVVEWCEVGPGGVVIVEAISVLHSDLDVPWHLRIWVDCPQEIRLARGIARDGEGMRSTWVDEWIPAEDRYVAAENPRGRADLVFDGSGQ